MMKSQVTKEGFVVVNVPGDVSIARARSSQDIANQDRVGGFDDWVLPDSMTLLALFKASPELRNGRVYWSSSTPPKANSMAGVFVSSASGFIGGFDDDDRAALILVPCEQMVEIVKAGHNEYMLEAKANPASRNPSC